MKSNNTISTENKAKPKSIIGEKITAPIEFVPLILVVVFIFISPRLLPNMSSLLFYPLTYFLCGFFMGCIFKKSKNFFREIIIIILLYSNQNGFRILVRVPSLIFI